LGAALPLDYYSSLEVDRIRCYTEALGYLPWTLLSLVQRKAPLNPNMTDGMRCAKEMQPRPSTTQSDVLKV